MSRQCEMTGKTGMVGNRVSHAKNRTKVRLLPNLHKKRIYSAKHQKFVTVRLSTQALRSINKMGFDTYCSKMGLVVVG